MRASVSQIKNGVLSYIDAELIGKVPGIQQWVLIAAVNVISNKADAVMAKLIQHPLVKQLELVDENGLVDVDCLKSGLDEAANKTGAVVQYIPLIGSVTFNKSDIQSLYEHIGRA